MKKFLVLILFTLTLQAFGQFRPKTEKMWYQSDAFQGGSR